MNIVHSVGFDTNLIRKKLKSLKLAN